MKVADVGRVVEVQLDVRCEQLVLVEVSRSMSRFLKYIGLTGGGSRWLLARTASRAWTGCRIAGACRGRSWY